MHTYIYTYIQLPFGRSPPPCLGCLAEHLANQSTSQSSNPATNQETNQPTNQPKQPAMQKSSNTKSFEISIYGDYNTEVGTNNPPSWDLKFTKLGFQIL